MPKLQVTEPAQPGSYWVRHGGGYMEGEGLDKSQYRKQTRKMIFQTWVPWMEEWEVWSSYFSRLKKTKREAMTSLRDGAGVEHHLNKGILEMVATCYQEFYNHASRGPGGLAPMPAETH